MIIKKKTYLFFEKFKPGIKFTMKNCDSKFKVMGPLSYSSILSKRLHVYAFTNYGSVSIYNSNDKRCRLKDFIFYDSKKNIV